MASAFLLLGLGLGLLVAGAEVLVRAAAALALRLGVSPLLVGITIVAMGTSSPELVVSLRAALAGDDAIAVGNVVGSNICNIALILGLAALIRPLSVQMQLIRLDVPVMIASSAALWLALAGGHLGRIVAALFIAGLFLYILVGVRQARREAQVVVDEVAAAAPGARGSARRAWIQALLIAAGLALLAAGADLFVQAAVRLSESLGVSRAVIGLTVVALGTSLPELATSVVAALRRHADLAIGNIVGSNIFNILGILGLAGLVHPLEARGIGTVDLAVMTALALLMLPLMRTGFRLSRGEGGILLVSYVLYVLHLMP